MPHRIGIGTDLHRLAPGGGLHLGGVHIPCHLHAVAHSDGDALLHAITDAMLGAIGAGDIGELFPDTAEENRGRCSEEFLQEALLLVREAGYFVVNIDAVIHLQQPKISPYKLTIRRNISTLCGVNIDSVNLKGKTGEGIGAVGRNETIETQAVVLLNKIEVNQ